MGLILFLGSFAIAFGATSDVANLVGVYWLGIWDPKWTQESNVAIFRYVLPAFVAIASLSCFVGARKFAGWLRGRSGTSISIGVASGVLAAAVLFVLVAAGRTIPGSAVVEPLVFLVGPAVISNVLLTFTQRQFPADA